MITIDAVVKIILILVIAAVLIYLMILLNYRTTNKKDNLIFVLIAIFAILVLVLLIYDGFIVEVFNDHSLHLGWIIGLIALILLSIGTILVLYNEEKFVLWHGLAAGSAWILTLLNVISLITLNDVLQVSYSGTVHFIHIVLGGVGLGTGLASMLLGISGQRKLAKLSGFITFAFWWGAFFLGLFL